MGVILRSKILFELPGIDYNHLLKVHSNFAFEGWVSLALMILLVYGLLSDSQKNKMVYKFVFIGTFATAWALIFTFALGKVADFTSYILTVFIFISYVFSWVFIKDIRKTEVNRTVKLLSISAIICAVLSSGGPFFLTYLFATKSLNAVLYRDTLFSYLHLQYNGFFTLSVLALLFNKVQSKLSERTNRDIHRFAVLIASSILPSMFISYDWAGPNTIIHAIAYIGSILSLLSLGLFIPIFGQMKKLFREIHPLLRFIWMVSIASFMAKMFFQSFTIINFIGNPIFGDRPIIMGFLHLVFLGFVTLFLLYYIGQEGILNIKKSITKIALLIFTIGIIVNIALLLTQGLGDILIKSSPLFPLLLWGAGLWLFAGAVLICIARIKSWANSVDDSAV